MKLDYVSSVFEDEFCDNIRKTAAYLSALC